jgi:cytochrome c oxidase subunit 1
MHPLGISGMPRRIADYAPEPIWVFWNLVSTVGAFLIAASILPFLVNVVATLINGERVGDDPWEGNTLEWATSSPPPPYNFDRLPPVRSERPVFDLRHKRDAEHLAADNLPVAPPPDAEGNVGGQPGDGKPA